MIREKTEQTVETVHTHTHTHTSNLKEGNSSYIIEGNNRHY